MLKRKMQLTRGKLNKREKLQRVAPSIVYRLFNPQVPVVICTKSGRDVAAMPANSCSSASHSPPMISVAIKAGTRTDRMLRKAQVFSINWMNFEPPSSRDTIIKLANPSSEKENHDKLKLNDIPYNLFQEVPILDGACAFARCKVKRYLRTGDHNLYIAQVSSAMALRDFTAECYWRFKTYKPILYVGSIRANPMITI